MNVELVTVGTAVGGVCEERNDLYRLLGIDTWRIRLTTWFDDQDKIREQFIEPLPDNPDFDALLEPVLDWAAAEKPAELAALFPDERLERNRDTARRWRTLLEEWAYVRLYRSNEARLAALPRWLESYNRRRPHTALGGRPPISRLSTT